MHELMRSVIGRLCDYHIEVENEQAAEPHRGSAKSGIFLGRSSMEPRGLKRADAAKYCGISPATFSRWIAVGIMPRSMPGTRVWDRVALDRALDKVSAVSITASQGRDEVERWFEEEAQQNARAS